MFSYRKLTLSVSDAAEMFTETFLQSPSSLSDVQTIAVTTRNAVHNILRLIKEVVTNVVCSSALVEKSGTSYTSGIEAVGRAMNQQNFSEIVVDKFIRVTRCPEVFFYLCGSVHKISIITADPAKSKKLTVGNCPLAVIRR